LIAGVDDDRHQVAALTNDFVVHEEVLQFFAAALSERRKAVTRAPVSNRETPDILIEPDDRHSIPACNQRGFEGIGHLGRHDATRLWHVNLSWDRQRIPE